MLRGINVFICRECNKKFIGLDIELACTVNSVPLKCPKCGGCRTRPIFSSDSCYKEIWESYENDVNKKDVEEK